MNTGKKKSYLCPKDHRKNWVIYWGGYIPGNITGAISFLLNITGAIAPVAPMLNTPLYVEQQVMHSYFILRQELKVNQGRRFCFCHGQKFGGHSLWHPVTAHPE